MADRAHWTEDDTSTFIDLCLQQVRLGKRVSGHLKQSTFTLIGKQFQQLRGKPFTVRQLRNKWDSLRKQWEKWNWLVRYATSGVGWDDTNKTFTQDEEWWWQADEAYKRTKEGRGSILCFRDEGLRHKDKFDELFQGSKGTNKRLWTPASSTKAPGDSSSPDSREGSGDSDGDPRFKDPLVDSPSGGNDSHDYDDSLPPVMAEGDTSSKRKTPSSSLRKRTGKRRYSRDDLTADLGNLIANLNAKSSASSKSLGNETDPYSMKELMQKLWSLPVVVEDEQFGLDAASILMDDKLRHAFLALPTDSLKTGFLKRHVEKYRKENHP